MCDQLYQYTFTMKHDKGKVKITVKASSLAFATQRVLNLECAPERAIKNIKIQEYNGNNS